MSFRGRLSLIRNVFCNMTRIRSARIRTSERDSGWSLDSVLVP